MQVKVFYSWQSDLPSKTNRGFIEKCLEGAIKITKGDNEVEVEPVLDRDTKGVSGSPDIAATIFQKISAAEIFVADVSFINANHSIQRACPNPNVLVELGYALNALGHERVILVFNTASGKLGDLPFDLRMRRVSTYNLPIELSNKSNEKAKLQSLLAAALKPILLLGKAKAPAEEDPLLPVEQSIKSGEANQNSLVKGYMDELCKRFKDIAPPSLSQVEEEKREEVVLGALTKSKPLVEEYCRLVKVAVSNNSEDAIRSIVKGFGGLADSYYLLPGNSGPYTDSDFDTQRFLGHELFVSLIAMAIDEDRWNLVAAALSEDIRVSNYYGRSEVKLVDYEYIGHHNTSFLYELGRKNGGQISLRANLLSERHSSGELGQLVPITSFTGADFWISVCSDIKAGEQGDHWNWLPWSYLYLKETPEYLLRGARIAYANKLVEVSGAKDLSALKDSIKLGLAKANKHLTGMFPSVRIRVDEVDSLGSR